MNDEIKNLIAEQMPGAEVHVTDFSGKQDHLNIVVISDLFAGKRPLKQHQMVMDILKEKLHSGELHAVQLKTLTTQKAREYRSKGEIPHV